MLNLNALKSTLEGRGLPVSRVYLALDGAPMLESPLFRGPTLVWNALLGTPVDRDSTWTKDGTRIIPKAAVHSAKHSFSLPVAERIKREYWSGKQTGGQLARAHGVNRLTIWRLVHGLNYWWV